MSSQLLFRVVDKSGHEFLIYTDGKVEGFGEEANVYNYHPQIVRSAMVSSKTESGREIDLQQAEPHLTLEEVGIQGRDIGK